MKIKQTAASIFFIFHLALLNAQSSDSITTKRMIKTAIIPTALIISGSIINGSQLEKDFQANLRNKVGNTYECRIDNYLPFAPIAEIYIADIAGVKSKNNWFDQTKYLCISNLITSGITHILKYSTSKTRPKGGSNSFPSGHTSFAFTNATVLFNEFNQTSKVLAYSGYAFAATTGTFRMLNNKHWLSDVLVGAGIGILVTDLVYYIEPLKNFNPFKNSKHVSFVPYIDDNNYEIYFAYRF